MGDQAPVMAAIHEQWFVIALNSLALRQAVKKRVRVGEKGARSLVQSQQAVDETIIEQSCSALGVTVFCPRDAREKWRGGALVRVDRPELVPGYGFVCGVTDFKALTEARGVAGILGTRGEPLPIDPKHIAMLANAEASALLDVSEKQRRRAQRGRRRNRKQLVQAYPPGTRVEVEHSILGRFEAVIDRVADRGHIRVLSAELGSLGKIDIDPSSIVDEEAA